ncbi:MAG TPA: alpha-amylase family glycosyl hydrolase [Thermoanaerobaculia bacterium]|jgi:glycosidase|nr:alpha-amylase family glycosyl hydrolase [Thermoanaerobaculia bacterium]
MAVAVPDLLRRRERGFVLWRPSGAADVPVLVTGTFRDGGDGEAELVGERRFELRETLPGLWELPAAECGLDDGTVYHYWFEVEDTNVYKPAGERQRIRCTDPAATAVDWRLLAPQPTGPYGEDDRDPAAVALFRDGRLLPCDPGGETIDWSDDAPLASLPPNDRLVIYELPTSWVASGRDGALTVGVGTFRDAMSLLTRRLGAVGFTDVPALAAGRSHLGDLGVNALELLPPADSFSDRARTYNLWGYATSNYLSADFDLGRPGGVGAPRASVDLAALVALCHRHGVRFFYDAVMAFAQRDPYQNVDFLDFHVQFGAGDPEQAERDGFGGDLWKYARFVDDCYDPISGAVGRFCPARQWMQLHVAHWMRHYRIDGIRMDSVNNVRNYDFVGELKDAARESWRQRWAEEAGEPHAGDMGVADERFLVVGEELAVPLDLLRQRRLDGLWNEIFKRGVRRVILGETADFAADDFAASVHGLVDCRRLGFADGAQAVNYVTSHDVSGFGNERLYDFLEHNQVFAKLERMQLAFAVLLTAVGIPMILAGEELGDRHDLALAGPDADARKQVDPVNFERLEDSWRRQLFEYVSRLVHLRTRSAALASNDTELIHTDLTPGRRVLAWLRGRRDGESMVVVVANFSDWHSERPEDPATEYVVRGWPAAPAGRRWREVTQGRDVPAEWAGREPLFSWEAKVYELVT